MMRPSAEEVVFALDAVATIELTLDAIEGPGWYCVRDPEPPGYRCDFCLARPNYSGGVWIPFDPTAIVAEAAKRDLHRGAASKWGGWRGGVWCYGLLDGVEDWTAGHPSWAVGRGSTARLAALRLLVALATP